MIRTVKYVDYELAWSSLHGQAQPTRMIRLWLKVMFVLTTPIRKVSPNTITISAGVFAFLLMYIATKPQFYWFVALGIFLLGVLDAIDGVIAVRTGKTSSWGAFLDSFVDRIVDAAIAVALILAGASLSVTIIALTMTLVHEYMRARASSVGYRLIGIVTVAEKPTRIIIGMIAFIAASLVTSRAQQFMTITAWVWCVLATFAVIQLFSVYRRALRRM